MLWARTVALDRGQRCVGVHVTRARAVFQLTDRVADIRVFMLLVGAGVITARMASRTVRLIGRRPVGDGLRIGEVAGRAWQVIAVIERLKVQPPVRENIGNPSGSHMTHVALLLRYEMSGVLTGGGYTIVTRVTRSQHLRVVNGRDWYPAGRRMAVFADIRCADVRRVLAGRISAIVATKAIAGDVDVIEVGRNPGNRRVAVIAGVTAYDMCRVLAGRSGAVMAGRARTKHLCMIDGIRRCPDNAVVAVLADIRGLHVRW